jgi:hypothetical protein
MPMVQIGIMGVAMGHRCMSVPMAVWPVRFRAVLMIVLMMRIMNVAMFMLERIVRMVVAMRFGQMQPESDGHQNTGNDEGRGDRLPEERDRQQRPDERRRREIGA